VGHRHGRRTSFSIELFRSVRHARQIKDLEHFHESINLGNALALARMGRAAHCPAMTTPDRSIFDLGHVDTWVFDLDNTLYPAEINLFDQVDQRMGEFIARELDLSFEDARRLQKKYYIEYGTTLTGLVSFHGIEPEAFLDYVHDIDVSMIKPSVELDALLAELRGRKIVFTNGSLAHAERVTAALNIGHHFHQIYDIAAADYMPKHEIQAFEKFVERADFEPTTGAMFDDIARNLRPAHALGMKTIWIRTDHKPGWPKTSPDRESDDKSFIDHEADDLLSFLKRLNNNNSTP